MDVIFIDNFYLLYSIFHSCLTCKHERADEKDVGEFRMNRCLFVA
jgi:hypothetical protein